MCGIAALPSLSKQQRRGESTNRRLFAAVVLLPVFLSLQHPIPTKPSLTWWVANGLEKVRPYDPEPSPAKHVGSVSAARNEFEPFQIILKSQSADIADVDLDVTDLRNS